MDNQLKHRVIRIGLTVLVFGAFALMFVPFIAPLLMAVIFAFALDPIVSRFGIRKAKRQFPTLAILIAFFSLVTLPIVILSTRIFSKVREIAQVGWQNTQVYKMSEKFASKAIDIAQNAGLQISGEEAVGSHNELFSRVGSWALQTSTDVATRAPEFILALFIFSAALFFFLTESRLIKKSILQLDLLSGGELNQIINIVQRTSYITLVSTALIGTVQASVVTLGGWITGFSELLLIFFITLLTSFIPVIGAAPVALGLSLMSFLQNDISSGVIMLVVAVIAGSIDNILKPIILSANDEELHPIVSLIAIIGAIVMYGLPGLLLGPIITGLAFKIIPILFANSVRNEDASDL